MKRHGWTRMMAFMLCLAITGVASIALAATTITEPEKTMQVRFMFSKSMYEITIIVENGVVTPAGTNGVLTVLAGSDAVFSFTPDTGYRLQQLREDGETVWSRTSASDEPPTGTYFEYISRDHILEVLFLPIATATPVPTASPTASSSAGVSPTTAPTARPGGGGGVGSGASATVSPLPTERTTISLSEADTPQTGVVGNSGGDCIE